MMPCLWQKYLYCICLTRPPICPSSRKRKYAE